MRGRKRGGARYGGRVRLTNYYIYKVNKLQELIVQCRECSQYFIIAINRIKPLKLSLAMLNT